MNSKIELKLDSFATFANLHAARFVDLISLIIALDSVVPMENVTPAKRKAEESGIAKEKPQFLVTLNEGRVVWKRAPVPPRGRVKLWPNFSASQITEVKPYLCKNEGGYRMARSTHGVREGILF